MRGLALEERPGLGLAVAAAAAAVVTGLLVGRSPVLATLAIVGLGLGVSAMRYGAVAVVVPAFGVLPWLVVLEGVLPPVVGTITAAIAAASLLFLVAPLKYESPMVPIASFVFVAIVLVHAVYATDGDQAIQAAKYMVFPAIVLAITSERAREILPSLKGPVLASCLAAMVFHLGVIAVGAGSTSTYYEAGEELGFAADGPHALALMAMIVAAAGLAVERVRLQVVFFALGAVPVALSGVRSALVGLAVILLVYIMQSRSKMIAAFVLGVVAAVALAAGAMDVITERFVGNPHEFSSFATAGSGRGEIWTAAFDAWGAAGPGAWFFGTGLRSIVGFELAALGAELVGHSDIVEVLVQVGLVGFAAWLALWMGLLRAHLRAIVLLPILAFGVVNGSLEYVAPLTAGLFLAAACAKPRPSDAPT
jgi:O-antigen ligase/polysaccharide polymerase Wzy-like membrane protein